MNEQIRLLQKLAETTLAEVTEAVNNFRKALELLEGEKPVRITYKLVKDYPGNYSSVAVGDNIEIDPVSGLAFYEGEIYYVTQSDLMKYWEEQND